MTVCVSEVANQAYEILCGPHFPPIRQNPSLMAQWDKRGLYCWRVVGLLGRVVFEVYGAGCYGGTTPFSGFQRQAEGLMTGWMVFYPFFWACVIAGDRASIVTLCQSALGQWGPQSSGAYLSWLERNLSFFFMCNGVCWHSWSLQCSLWYCFGSQRQWKKKWVCVCGRSWGLGQTSIFNLGTVVTQHSWTLSVDHTAPPASREIQQRGLTFSEYLLDSLVPLESPSQRWFPSNWRGTEAAGLRGRLINICAEMLRRD